MVELLVSILISLLLLAAFTGFYLSQQKSLRHNQAEIEASNELRTALEQISRDLRSARMDITGAAAPGFLTADTTRVEFELDANDNPLDVNERKGFRLDSANKRIEQYDFGVWIPLAENITALSFTYRDCCRNPLAAPVAAPGANIATIDVSMTVSRPIIAGLPVTRTEAESVRLRNVSCVDVACP